MDKLGKIGNNDTSCALITTGCNLTAYKWQKVGQKNRFEGQRGHGLHVSEKNL